MDGCLACGHTAVEPAPDDSSDREPRDTVLERVHDRLFSPHRLEVDLLDSGGLVAVAFRVIVGISALFVVVAVLALLL